MWFISLLFIPAYAHVIGSLQNFSSDSPCTDKNHLFMAPGVFSAGGVNRACISRFYPEGSARMAVTLLSDYGESVTAARDLLPGDGGCLDIAAPMRPNSKADLIVNMRYKDAACVWEKLMTVRIGSGRVVSLMTERARYRPGDTLKLRAIVLKADFTPAPGDIQEIWLEGPRGAWDGVRVAQWLGVRTRLGLAQLQHQLDEHAPPGKWTVRASLADGSQGAAAFTVGNYELPPFQLSVRHSPKVLRTSDRLVWTVCVRYPWSEAVEGMLVIRLRGAGAGGEGGGGVRTAVRLRAPRACHRHAAAARRVGLAAPHPPHIVVADFSFQEDGTRIWQNTTVVSEVVEDPITLEFLTKHRAVLSPSLPYKLKVKATRLDDKPAVGERVKVCRRTVVGEGTNMNLGANMNSEPHLKLRPNPNLGLNMNLRSNVNMEMNAFNASMGPAICVRAVTDSRGVARLTFAADPTNNALYHFQASLGNATALLVLPSAAGASRAALGPLRPPPHSPRALVPLYLDLPRPIRPLTVHFVVITRGGTIYRWGATTQCPTTTITDQLLPAPRDGSCEVQFPELNNVDSGSGQDNSDSLEGHLPRIMLPVRVSHQMCPDSHLMAYFLYDGELVSASKHFEMDECFANKAEAQWTSRQVGPGGTASLSVSTPGPALCALSALDVASTWAQRPPSTADQLLTGLRKLLDARRNLTEYDAAGDCFLALDGPSAAESGEQLAAEWLAGAGVRVLPPPRAPRCRPPPPAQIRDDVTPPRADFSEAWLWRLVAVGLNGTVTSSARAPDSITRYEASAVCLSRTGIAIAPPALLQVFREFFIHADGPKRLRKGDNTIIRYRIFNYLYEPLSVKIEVSGDSMVEVRSAAVSACLVARGSVAGRVEVRARGAGAASLRVRARSSPDDKCSAKLGTASDEVIIEIEVEPEGVPTQEFKSTMLCAGVSEPMASNVSWSWSRRGIVPGTETVTVWAATDALGPMLADADALVAMPRGCGEQNMARLATNLLALRLLDPKTTAAAKALRHVHRGFARQLQYAHPSGGFSAFGPSDAGPSTWLTAFCLRYLRTAYQVISPGARVPPVIERAERWLLAQQMENGCFRNEGQVFHRELKGGLNEDGEIASVALTAYVITSLVEGSANLPFRVIRNSLSCLRALPLKKSTSHTGIYAHSLLSYAFMRLRRYEEELRKTNEAYLYDRRESTSPVLRDDEDIRELMQFLKLAKRHQDYVYWESSSLATSIEATAYGVLSLAQCPPWPGASCRADAAAAARWLAAHASPSGGFVSTQDTLVAMEALSVWSSLQPAPPANLTVVATAGRRSNSVALLPTTKVPDIIKLEGGDQLTVTVKGQGCALVQATRSYRTTDISEEEKARTLNVHVSVKTEGAFDCANGTNCFCAAIVEACVAWSGSFPEMALLEVTLPGGFGADAGRLYSQLNQRDTLLRRIELSPKGGQAALYLSRSDSGTSAAHRCVSVHAVGPQASTRPAHVKLFDYYRPSVKSVQMYTIPEDCPARITHTTDSYLPKDNLFNKAKSLDTDELIISEEFSFEDIPEGTPLEDPMFENLTRMKDVDTEENNRTDAAVINTINGKENTSMESINPLKDNIINIQNETYTEDKSLTKVRQKYLKEAIKEVPQVVNKTESSQKMVDNPNLSDFHVIDSEKDLEVPTGVEGPVPSVVLPPKDFVYANAKTDIQSDPRILHRPFALNFEQVIRHRMKTNNAKG